MSIIKRYVLPGVAKYGKLSSENMMYLCYKLMYNAYKASIAQLVEH